MPGGHGTQGAGALDRTLIGPPLPELIRTVLDDAHFAQAPALARTFAARYDGAGYRESTAYPGVDELLRALHAAAVPLSIVTNKRREPTVRLLQWLGWSELFGSVSTLDSSPGCRSKADVVGQLIAGHGADRLLIGDSPDDARAARANQLPFAWASWGYGAGLELLPGEHLLSRPAEILGLALPADDNGAAHGA